MSTKILFTAKTHTTPGSDDAGRSSDNIVVETNPA
jgi:hypothetical protein